MEKKWVENRLDQIYQKTLNSISKHGSNMIPYQAKNGVFIENKAKTDITWWTNGFWGAILWQLNNYRGNKKIKDAAVESEISLNQAFLKYQGLHHDVGFMWLPTSVAHFRYNGDEKAYWNGRHAADLLAGRYNPAGQYLRSWNRDRAGWVIIDSMINIQLLYWASDETKDPRFKQMADNHAHTVMNNHVRPDGSVSHIVVFDPNNGQKIGNKTGQGYDQNSSWTRGQGWALYGFALAYRHSKKEEYLQTAKKVANYFLANISQTDYIPVVDFRSPERTGTDTSAASIAACGLLEIALYCDGSEAQLYRDGAENILKALDKKYADYNSDHDGIIIGATTAYHEDDGQNINLNYGDYYYIEALLRLIDDYMFIW